MKGPLFKWFGSKWLSSKTLPKPNYPTIIEPFGGAGYSLRYADKNVIICECNPNLFDLWSWLINEATKDDILSIPLNLPEGLDIRTIGLSEGQALLLKNWQRTNNVGNCWTISSWGNKPGQWTENTRARVADEFSEIGHWRVINDAFQILDPININYEATWFIDPPYEFNYQYNNKRLDYQNLANKIKVLFGQVIVCEAICPKTGTVPNWLQFEFFGERVTSRRGADNNHHSKELIYQQGK